MLHSIVNFEKSEPKNVKSNNHGTENRADAKHELLYVQSTVGHWV